MHSENTSPTISSRQEIEELVETLLADYSIDPDMTVMIDRATLRELLEYDRLLAEFGPQDEILWGSRLAYDQGGSGPDLSDLEVRAVY